MERPATPAAAEGGHRPTQLRPMLQLLPLLLPALATTTAVVAPSGRCCQTGAGCADPEGCMDPEVQPFCAASKADCEGKCKHMWCPDGGGGANGSTGSFAIQSSRSIFNVSEKYVSFTFDLSAKFESDHNFTDPAFIAAAK